MYKYEINTGTQEIHIHRAGGLRFKFEYAHTPEGIEIYNSIHGPVNIPIATVADMAGLGEWLLGLTPAQLS